MLKKDRLLGIDDFLEGNIGKGRAGLTKLCPITHLSFQVKAMRPPNIAERRNNFNI
jgi:hypothetical protein